MLKTLSPRRRAMVTAISAGLLLGAAGPAAHAAYPDKPIRLVVPFATGGTTTILARMMAERIGNDLGETVVVDNRPGAGGNIGMDHVAKSAPDGYTILMGPIGLAINPALYSNMPFNPLTDLAPIGLYGGVPNLLVVNPSVPAKSVSELIAHAKANPGKLVYASNGNGTSSHLAAEMLKSVAGVDIRHVPYKGGGPAMQDLLGGHVHMLFDQMPAVLPQVQANKVTALGVSSLKRSDTAPDIPAISETLPGFDMVVWFGLLAPKGTPDDVIQKLNASMNKVLADPAYRERLASMGVTPMPSTPAEFSSFMKNETERWGEVVKKSGAAIN
ncbi:MAG: Bug family tripartite tricarboxylate transporter substrate binding protein [Burkholderiaceae bacterium]|jgi:tripartite-type tricarboxylate transporter receptor subunit TctC